MICPGKAEMLAAVDLDRALRLPGPVRRPDHDHATLPPAGEFWGGR